VSKSVVESSGRVAGIVTVRRVIRKVVYESIVELFDQQQSSGRAAGKVTAGKGTRQEGCWVRDSRGISLSELVIERLPALSAQSLRASLLGE
jgi:hypothetical protein